MSLNNHQYSGFTRFVLVNSVMFAVLMLAINTELGVGLAFYAIGSIIISVSAIVDNGREY